MKVERKDAGQEKRILTGMIVSPAVLGKLAPKWDKEGLLAHPWSNLIGQWCVDYHNSYGKAPGKNIVALFESWADDNPDKEQVALVDKFLDSLSGEYSSLAKEVNPDLIIDQAGVYFNRVKLAKHKEGIEGDLENGDVDKALKRFDSFRKIELGVGSYVDVLRDEDAIRRAFEQKADPLITYPGAVGEFVGDALERDGFIALMGPEKRGKTWWLLDLAWQAMKQRRKVAFFEVGDLSEAQIMRRFMVRAARAPMKPKLIKVPTKFARAADSDDGEIRQSSYTVEYDERNFEKALAWGVAWKACQKVVSRSRTKESLLRLGVYPNSSVSVNGIRSQCEAWVREGWCPDVVVIDYADILAPVNGTADTRDQINTTWKLLRRLSQEMHCLVITATQSDADSYDAAVIRRNNFSEDKRKLAHVTGMLGLNQNETEKEDGVYRLNWIVLREAEYGEKHCCYVAGCLALASPVMRSFY